MRAHVFPGQGIQKRGMGRGVFEHFPDLCRQADAVLGYSVEALCLEDRERLLSRTEYAQPAIYVVNALHHLMGRQPADFLAGHSLGEYNALLAAGAFDFATGLTLVKRRAELMGGADGGGMAAVVGVTENDIEEALAANGVAGVVIANHNAPEQFVLSGGRDELARIRPVFEAMENVRGFVPLRVSGAFHSPRMEAAAGEFRALLDRVDFGELQTPVISNVTGRPYESGPRAVREALAAQITQPVRWAESIRYLRNAGVSEFVEIGESRVLTSLIDRIAAAEPPAGGGREEMVGRIRREVLKPVVGDVALDFDENQSFRQLGMDSIVYVRLARRVEAVFGIPFKPDMIYANRTCAALADHLLARQDSPRAEPENAEPEKAEPEKAEPEKAAPWREYRDERVLALLRDCVNGILSVEQVIETIRPRGVT